MKYDLDFTGKVALVVGGSSGIGNGIAQALRQQGATVHAWGTRATSADYADDRFSDMDGIAYQQMDVRDGDAIAAYEAPFDRLDVLVLCQGIALYKRQEFEMKGFREVVDINLTSLMSCMTRFRDDLVASAGNIVIVSSSAAFHATRGNPGYAASKAGAMGLARTMAQVLAPDGVRVNSIAPGFVPTKMTEVTTGNDKHRDTAQARIPMGRFGTVEEMAGMALFLASPLAGYMTGQTLIGDGGMLL